MSDIQLDDPPPSPPDPRRLRDMQNDILPFRQINNQGIAQIRLPNNNLREVRLGIEFNRGSRSATIIVRKWGTNAQQPLAFADSGMWVPDELDDGGSSPGG